MGTRWILSRRDDLLWLQGSALAGVLLGAAFACAPRVDGSGRLGLALLVVWGVLFDATHVWGTWARSYLAPDAASRALAPKARTFVLFFAAGPAAAVLDHGLGVAGAFSWFLLACYVWAYWHLVRQHYGILALYRRRDGAVGSAAAWALWIGCVYPVVRFSLGAGWEATGLPALVPPAVAPVARAILDAAAVVAAAGALLRLGRTVLAPRHLFVAGVLALHVGTFAVLRDLAAITATLTIFHNLQYHRMVWQYERGLGRAPSGGLAPYLAWGVGLGLVWYVPRVVLVPRLGEPLWHDVALGLVWGVALHHYFVDGRIWRLRRGPVAATLDAAARA